MRRGADRKPLQGFEQMSYIIILTFYFKSSTLVLWRLDYKKARVGIEEVVYSWQERRMP